MNSSDANLNPDTAIVSIVGLGYVGLPLAKAFARSLKVIGFDNNVNKINNLNQLEKDRLTCTADPGEIGKADFIIICVPTPLTPSQEPDLSYVESAARMVGQNMMQGSTVILESTVYPGVTEEIVVPILEKESGLKCGKDFQVGYSPERINPGDTEHTVDRTVKVVAGMNEETTEVLAALYGKVTPGIYRAKNIRTAEAAKLVENIQRDLNIGLMNELSIIFEKMGLNTRDVLEAASTKWNFHRYSPGLVGGYCIPVNPHYLAHKAEGLGYHPQVILAGRVVNNQVPAHIAGMTIDALAKAGKAIKDSTVLIMGLTYKADISDIRESATKQLVKELKNSGVRLVGFDPTVDAENYKNNWEEEFDIRMLWDVNDIRRQKVDGIIITVAHSLFRKLSIKDLKEMQNNCPILIDIPGIYDAEEVKKAGFYYRTL